MKKTLIALMMFCTNAVAAPIAPLQEAHSGVYQDPTRQTELVQVSAYNGQAYVTLLTYSGVQKRWVSLRYQSFAGLSTSAYEAGSPQDAPVWVISQVGSTCNNLVLQEKTPVCYANGSCEFVVTRQYNLARIQPTSLSCVTVGR
jgi:hypothetical protein